MKEDFLNFIWQHQYYEKNNLHTCRGKLLQILNPGVTNHNSGPDFSNARIKVGATNWAGAVEIHIRSSDWYLHNHHQDPLYDQVILHVVWTNNSLTKTSKARIIPTLELKDRVEEKLLLRHDTLKNSISEVPCGTQFHQISHAVLHKMLQQAAGQRLVRKSGSVKALLHQYRFDWDQVTYMTLGKNFGFKINNEAFEELVRTVPLSIIRKNRLNTIRLEALFYGQAGFLNRTTGDAYYRKLQSEYQYLKRKYSLTSVMRRERWNYLRLRPPNFPSLRIAQFVALMHQGQFRFSNIRSLEVPGHFEKLDIRPSSYWLEHYDFGKKWARGSLGKYRFGKSGKLHLLINVVVPLQIAYSDTCAQPAFKMNAIKLLNKLPPEQNRIISYWKDKGFKVSSAYYSQGLLELNNNYCKLKRCLNCLIGRSLLARNHLE